MVFRKSKHQFVFYLFVRIINGNVKICIFVDVRLDVVDTRPGAAHVCRTQSIHYEQQMAEQRRRMGLMIHELTRRSCVHAYVSV